MDEVLEVLKGVRPDIDFANETGLVTEGLLDSFDIITLIGELNDEFDIEIRPADMLPENFDSAEAIWQLVSRLQDD